jgi:hypothetical protein
LRRLGLIALVSALLLSLGISALAQAIQNVELHGYMQNRFYSTESVSGRFVMERVSLQASAKLGEDGQAYVEMYIHPWLTDTVVGNKYAPPGSTPPAAGTQVTAEEFRTYLESAYVDLPLMGGRIRIGKGRQLNFGMTPSYPNRKISQYGILAETFTQDRIVGAQYARKSGIWDGGMTLFTDQSLGTRNIADIASNTKVVPHIVDKDVPGAVSGKLAVAGRIGVTTPCSRFHISGVTGALNPNQINWIGTAFGLASGENTNTDHNKWGFDAMYKTGSFLAQGEWYTGKFSLVGITGYQILFGYEPKDPGARRAYVRYAALNNDLAPQAPSASNPNALATWPNQQFTLALVQPIRKGVWVEVDWEKNSQRPPAGVSQIKDDVFFLELFTGF